ncbi:MAG: hypothetical protein IPK32_14350 [Verrucomicrobiaceae bacterium]|nr:hypothetical protein [Verrucomicrobiaceae bacterium]
MLFWGFIGAQVMIFFGRGIEQAWGAFRVTAYILGWFLSSAVCGLALGVTPGGALLAQTILFAFAVLYPNEELLLFFILPVKVKWIALVSAGFTLFQVVENPFYLLLVIPGTLNFLVAFGPDFIKGRLRHKKVADRRAQHQAAQAPEGSSFHQCRVCQKTELDDAALEFRVMADGEEICNVCRAKSAS